ncbi:coiled-coil-helix-coiled-coil-helix domain-containing protein 10, mitochondrial [Cyclospora cayetanensis]|uniref:Coiled-coil-helix-coiled-coil-helix domain-containing protein 10, mitochondrial n=1 Tax=Cyclospora cayetanensis TaxID=88456 RepID=A0A6P6RXF1_9EIME|nr:coiled-coil-helix-coiled-coil-helix domain-containing protein 10, mitochondrial [Cyclospora cayetanensis]
MPRQRSSAGARRSSSGGGFCGFEYFLSALSQVTGAILCIDFGVLATSFACAVGGSRSAHPAAPAPVAAPPSPPPMTGGGGGGFMSNMVGNVAGGMASGVGFGVAQRAVDAVMGPRSVEVVHTNNAPLPAPQTPTMQQGLQRDPCSAYQEELNQCMTRHTDIALCQNYLDNLKACQMQMNNGA